MSRGIAIEFALHFAIEFALHFALHFGVDLPHILPGKITEAPTSPNLAPKWPPATPYPRKSPQSVPYASSWFQNPRNPHPTRIFRDVCVSKSSRSSPYAAARNLCTLKIFCRPACSIFGAPKFSTCAMKNFKARPIKLFGHL